MKKQVLTLFIFLSLISCKDEKKESKELFCKSIEQKLTDTTLDYKTILKTKEKLFKELVLSNKSLKDDQEFINKFYEQKEITALENKIQNKIISNTQNILTNNTFTSGLDNYWQVHKANFDGKIMNFKSIQIDLRGNYENFNKSKVYDVIIEKNGKTYISFLKDSGEKVLLEFGKTKDNYYLYFDDKILLSPIKKSKK
jgi:hypothetical protein